MPLQPRNGQKGRGDSGHFGVEVASTNHFLKTEREKQPASYRVSVAKAPCATNDPTPTNRGDRLLLYGIATEHLNLTQLQPQAIEGSLNVDIMH